MLPPLPPRSLRRPRWTTAAPLLLLLLVEMHAAADRRRSGSSSSLARHVLLLTGLVMIVMDVIGIGIGAIVQTVTGMTEIVTGRQNVSEYGSEVATSTEPSPSARPRFSPARRHAAA